MTGVVVNRCNFEQATWYGSFWTAKYLIKYLTDKGIPFIDLYKDWATKQNFNYYIKDARNNMVSGVGHGNEKQYTGQNYDVLLDADNQSDLNLMKGKVISALSCEFGASANRWLNAGAECFHGYKVTYYFIVYSEQQDDPYGLLFGGAHYIFDIMSIENNGDYKKAHNETYEAYTQASQQTNDTATKRYLVWDRDGMVTVYQTAKPEPQKTCILCKKVRKILKCPIT